MRIAICQQNPAVGDFGGNIAKIKRAYDTAVAKNADIAVFSEGIISGYYAYDMMQKPAFIAKCHTALDEVVAYTRGKHTAMIVGCPTRAEPPHHTPLESRIAHITAVLIMDGKIVHTHHKVSMADEGVCIDSRVVVPSPDSVHDCTCVGVHGGRIGIAICEDIWTDDVCDSLASDGAEIIVAINASPFYYGKITQRHTQVKNRITKTRVPMVYVNEVGGYDGIVSDGASFVMDKHGTITTQCPEFETGVYMVDFDNTNTPLPAHHNLLLDFYPCLWRATTYGLKQYTDKNRFKGAVLGLSGGIDSALVASIATDALGANNVHALIMPSPYTRPDSIVDATQCANMLGISHEIIDITPMMQAFETALAPIMQGMKPDTTEENIQARIRGNIVMAVSNKYKWLALTTGNKSENAVGYATLYGDMCGGFNPIKDIYKTDVFALSTWRNTQGMCIPERIITKPPSAELRDNQQDSDSLPPYDILDGILKCFIEHDFNIAQTVQHGYDTHIVRHIWTLLHQAEHKRQQSALGLKLSVRDFSYDRLYPITNAYPYQDDHDTY